jgi:hypothetical protein
LFSGFLGPFCRPKRGTFRQYSYGFADMTADFWNIGRFTQNFSKSNRFQRKNPFKTVEFAQTYA